MGDDRLDVIEKWWCFVNRFDFCGNFFLSLSCKEVFFLWGNIMWIFGNCWIIDIGEDF